MTTFLRDNSCANTARICSNRRTSSRPFLSPTSVTTVKCPERYSCHCGSAARDGTALHIISKRRDETRKRKYGRRATVRRKGIEMRKCYHGSGRVAPGGPPMRVLCPESLPIALRIKKPYQKKTNVTRLTKF